MNGGAGGHSPRRVYIEVVGYFGAVYVGILHGTIWSAVLLSSGDYHCSCPDTSEANLKIKSSCESCIWFAPVTNLVTMSFHQNWR
jgi:hypothetical protein